jgi:hypothetical protein
MIRRLSAVAVVALAIGGAGWGCGDDEESPATSTSAAAAPTTTVDTGAADDGSQAAGQPPDAPAAGGGADADAGGEPAGGDAPVGSGAQGGGEPGEVLREQMDQQDELIDRIEAAAAAAREGDPQALEDLRNQLAPSQSEVRELRDQLEAYCAGASPRPPICDRLP